MPALKAYRREMYARLPGDVLGRVEAIAALTATTLTVTALATGGRSTDEFAGKFMLRPEAAGAADRTRRISSYDSTQGLFGHGGASYSDTTATGESVEIVLVEPYLVDNAIQVALGRLRRRHVTELPTVQGQTVYWLHALPWVTGPAELAAVTLRRSPVVTRDRYIESWGQMGSAGALLPDWWTLSGAGASVARSTAQNRRSQHGTAITRAGTDCVLAQDVGLLPNGTAAANSETLAGKQFAFTAVVLAGAAATVRAQWLDGTQTVSSAYHTGDGAWQELTAEGTIAPAATGLTVRVSVETNDGTYFVDECFGHEGALTDTIRRDEYGEDVVEHQIDQTGASVALVVPRTPRGQQLRVWTNRPYPQFDAARVMAGTADADVSDAPLAEVATLAIARLFEGLARNRGEDTQRYAMIAGDWRDRAERLAMQHLAMAEPPKGGAPLPRRLMGPAARRF